MQPVEAIRSSRRVETKDALRLQLVHEVVVLFRARVMRLVVVDAQPVAVLRDDLPVVFARVELMDVSDDDVRAPNAGRVLADTHQVRL